MRIKELEIINFRSIDCLKLNDIKSTVVIAGPNGCGKTQIFHAIRFLKSVYGGYQDNEIHHFWNEFNIKLDRKNDDLFKIFGDKLTSLKIEATFILEDSEKEYLKKVAKELITEKLWQSKIPQEQYHAYKQAGNIGIAPYLRRYEKEIEEQSEKELAQFNNALTENAQKAFVSIKPDATVQIHANQVLELIFSTYDPENLGVIDYHGAQRNYNRQLLGNVNLQIKSEDAKFKQNALYNYQNKYSNVKSELAESYVKKLISEAAGIDKRDNSSLDKSLQELFLTFFPGKEFIGPKPGINGTLDFPVRLNSGREHDIDDLSSGEKEVLFGYLRLYNSAPRKSIILIDEPELHLNPALLRGFPEFYHKYIGKEFNNQIWLLTHSDALLRQAVGQQDFSVFHMNPIGTVDEKENQIVRISEGELLEKAVMDLVGDLASYRPNAKVVFFEGGGDSNFDVWMTSELFPLFSKSVNSISLGSRSQVERLHELLIKASEQGKINTRFFSIVDRDAIKIEKRAESSFSWDRYHIENYLLESSYIFKVLQSLNCCDNDINSVDNIEKELLSCAASNLNDLVRQHMEEIVNNSLVSSIKTNIPRTGNVDVANTLFERCSDTKTRIEDLLRTSLSKEELVNKEQECEQKYKEDLLNGKWMATFKGRSILKEFCSRHVKKISYEPFRNLIISEMKRDGFTPAGMNSIITDILKS